MIGPQDHPPQFGVPVNFETGMPLSERQAKHLANLKEASAALTDAAHFAEGSNPPDGPFQEHVWMSPRMARGAEYLEIALMLMRKAALESP